MSNHTAGPWFADEAGNIWRRHPEELCQNGGRVAGDAPLAVVYKGFYHEGAVGFPVHANARLIAASPTMFDYIIARSALGDAEASAILESINAAR